MIIRKDDHIWVVASFEEGKYVIVDDIDNHRFSYSGLKIKLRKL